MAENQKDTIYVDIDDEITAIIDKVSSSHGKIIALVLPKRATVFQSVVNMKLLKRRADNVGKNLVLVTSEASLMPLAGAVGLHVAKTPSSKPEIPAGPVVDDLPENIDEPEEVANEPDFDPDKSAGKTVGELAGGAALGGAIAEDSIELDNSTPEETSPSEPVAEKASKGKKGGNKKLRIPNFNKFRLRLILGVVILLILIAAYIVGFKVLPHATIHVKTDASNVNSNISLVLDTDATKLDSSGQSVPAQVANQQKTYTGKHDATGKENQGKTSSGTITVTNCTSSSITVYSGTGASTNGLTYITQSTISLGPALFDGSGNCQSISGFNSTSVNIIAQSPGAQYDVKSANFSINGQPSDVSATGTTSGGSDKIVTIVSQSDINAAKKNMGNKDADGYKNQLEQQLKQNGLYPIPKTFTTNSSHVKTSADPGDQADSVTVTENITYSMFGVKKSDLEKVIKYTAGQQIDTKKQAILDTGLSSAKFEVSQKPSSTKADVSMSVTSVAGPDLDKVTLAEQAAGKKAGQIRDMIGKNPGVKSVTVDYSPFWVTATPSSPSKISIVIEKPANNHH